MIVISNYSNIHYKKYHLTTLVKEGIFLSEQVYLCSENKKEYKAILKVARITGKGSHRMIKDQSLSYGFTWEHLG